MKYKSKYMQLKDLYIGGAGTCALILYSNVFADKQQIFEYYLENALGFTKEQILAHPKYSEFMQYLKGDPKKLPPPL